MKLLLILSLFLFISCPNERKLIHRPINKIVKKFERLCDIAVNDVEFFVVKSLKHANKGWKGLGHCVYDKRDSSGGEIYISQATWKNLNKKQKEEFLFHELGHCTRLRRKHKAGYIIMRGRSCPSSLMEPKIFTKREIKKCYIPFFKYYIKELCGEKK